MSESTYLYSYKTTNDSAIGTGHVFSGPGLRGSAEVYLLQPLNEWAAKCYLMLATRIACDADRQAHELFLKKLNKLRAAEAAFESLVGKIDADSEASAKSFTPGMCTGSEGRSAGCVAQRGKAA